MPRFITADEYIEMSSNGIRPRYQVLGFDLHISSSNSKLGKIWNFSKLAGNGIQLDGNGQPISNVLGSCQFNCEGCYACASQALCRENVIRAWSENTSLSRSGWFEDYLRGWFIAHPAKRWNGEETRLFRINQSGEIEDVRELRVWANIAAGVGEQNGYSFAIYTKRFDIVREFMEGNNWELPFNLQINLSECDGYPAPADLKKYFPCFVWDTGQKEAANIHHCPAVLKPSDGRKKGRRNKGITCAQCKRCYVSGATTAVYNH